MNARERVLKALELEEPDKVPYVEWEIENPKTAEKLGFAAPGSASQTVKFDPEKFMTFLGKIRGFPKFINNILPKLTKTPKIFSFIIKIIMPQIYKFYIHLGVDLSALPIAPISFFKWIPPNIIVNEFGQVFEVKNIAGVLSPYYSGGYIKSEKIYEAFPKIDPEQSLGLLMYKYLLKSKDIKNNKILIAPGIFNGIFDSTYMGMGIESFSRAIVKNQSFVKRIIYDKEKAFISIIKNVLDETQSPVFMIGDDLAYNSGPFISPRYFKKLFLPSYKRISKVIRKRGAKFLFHTDGDINPFLKIDGFIDCFDMIHPWQVSANMDIFEAKEKYGNKVCISGNVPVELLVHKTPKEISDYVKKLLKKCAPGGGYMLSSGNSIVPEIPAKNYLSMLITFKKYRDYPIYIK
ncbi:MAG: uroporphyrinogen decarboxylase family protein [Promethearchaeota archaeon]